MTFKCCFLQLRPVERRTASAVFFLLIIALQMSCTGVVIIHPKKKDIIETVYASGKVIADNEYSLYALASGTVVKKMVQEGDAVAKNQILYVITNDAPVSKLQTAQANYQIAQSNLSSQSRILNDLKLSLQTAQAKLSNDSSTYFRLKNLWDENIGTKNNLDAAYTQYIISKNTKQSAEEKYYSTINDLNLARYTARSQLAVAQSDLDNYFIRSQANGTVFQTYKEPGESVKANEVVAIMGETANRIIKLAVDQQDVDRIRTGQDVLLKTDVTGNKIYHAVITKIYPLMNEADQTFRVDAVFADTSQQIFIHSSVEANIIIQKKRKALIIPQAAMVGNDSVKIKKEGRLKTVAVKTGIRTLDETEIINGLDESSQIILPAQ